LIKNIIDENKETNKLPNKITTDIINLNISSFEEYQKIYEGRTSRYDNEIEKLINLINA
jgi:flagellar biosynthesis regulator FlaF